MLDLLCPLCGVETERTGHIIWSCSSCIDVWAECNRKIQKCSNDEDDFLSILEKLTERLDDGDLELVAMVARKI